MLYLAMQNFSCTHRVIPSSNTLSTADASQLCVSVIISCVSDGADTLQFESIHLSLTVAHTSLGLCKWNCNPNSTSTLPFCFLPTRAHTVTLLTVFIAALLKRIPWLLFLKSIKDVHVAVGWTLYPHNRKFTIWKSVWVGLYLSVCDRHGTDASIDGGPGASGEHAGKQRVQISSS